MYILFIDVTGDTISTCNFIELESPCGRMKFLIHLLRFAYFSGWLLAESSDIVETKKLSILNELRR